MVHAPTQIWEKIQHRDFLGATDTFLGATAIAHKAQRIDPAASQVSCLYDSSETDLLSMVKPDSVPCDM